MSFYHALCGIWTAVRSEAHLRFHLAIANLIAVFAYLYGISAAEWAVLWLSIGSVISAELMNTALERAVDTATSEFSATAKLAKDAAAGAVLVLAAMSVVVGICLFGDIGRIGTVLNTVFGEPVVLIPCVLLGVIDILFLIFGGKNVK